LPYALGYTCQRTTNRSKGALVVKILNFKKIDAFYKGTLFRQPCRLCSS